MSIKKELVTGVFYTALAKYSGIVISLIVAGILARLITPEEFGIVAVATVIISFFSIFSDLGIGAAVVQNKTLTKNDLSHIFSFTIWSGIILTVLFFLCSWPISWYYKHNTTLLVICQILSINLFFASANIVPNALLYKVKAFRFIAWRSLGIQVAGGAIAVLAALQGAGLYALIINPVLSSILLFAVSYRKYPQSLKMTWGLAAIRKIFSFSAYQFLFNVINYFSRNLDKLLIGKYMNMTQLGYYEKSYRLMMLPLQNITHVLTPVMHPVFSDYQNALEKLTAYYEKIVRLLAFIGFPLSVFLWFSAGEITLIIFGPQWLPSVAVFRILALSVGIQIILSTSGSIFQASNDTRSLFICGVFSSCINVSGILLGIFFFGTLEAVARCIVITFTLSFLQCYWQMYRYTLHQSLKNFGKQLLSPLVLSALLAGGLYTVSLFPLHQLSLVVSLALKSGVTAVLCFIYIQLTGEYNLFKILKMKF